MADKFLKSLQLGSDGNVYYPLPLLETKAGVGWNFTLHDTYYATLFCEDDIWVAGSSYGKIVYTEDNGKNWMRSFNTSSGRVYDIYHAAGLWVASTQNEGMYYSSDAKTWTHSNITDIECWGAKYGGGIWVSYTASGLYYSIDGITWTISNITATCNQPYYLNGMWFAGNDSDSGVIYYSTDGKVWNASDEIGGSFGPFAYSNGIYVAGEYSYHGGFYYSTDGINWTKSNIAKESANDFSYIDDIWYACGGFGLYSSTDGKNWTMIWNSRDVGISMLSTIIKVNGLYVVGCTWDNGSKVGGIWYSTDCMSWQQSNITTGYFPLFRYSNNTLLTLDWYGTGIYFSKDKTGDEGKILMVSNGEWQATFLTL